MASAMRVLAGFAEVSSYKEEELFPEHSAQNWLYVSTDPFRRTCKAWLHRFKHHW